MIKGMRTTLSLEDDVMQAIKTYAETHDLSLARAALELIRRGMHFQIPIIKRNGLAVFQVPEDFPTITSERVYQLLYEE